jgi:hypothetical protein
MTTRTPNEIMIHWDNQTETEGWAYRALDRQGLIDSGAIEDCDTMDEAIDEACSILGVEIPTSDFAESKDEGGFAIWTSDFKEND